MPLIGTDEDQQPGVDPSQSNHGPGVYVPPSTASDGTAGGGSGFVGGSGGAGKTTTATPAGGGTAAASSGDNYTNLTDYLSANQGAGTSMGGAVSGVVGGVGQQTDKDLATYQGDVTKDINAATQNVDPSKVAQGTAVDSGTMDKITGGVTGGAVTNVTNPDGSVTTNTSAKTYGGPSNPMAAQPQFSYQAPAYAGPKSDLSNLSGQSAQDQSAAYGDLQKLVGGNPNQTQTGGLVGQAAGGQAGNAALLKSTYAQPSYTAGENNFDAAVLGGTSGGQQALSGIQSQWGKDNGSTQNAALGAAADQAQKTSLATNKTYSDANNAANTMNAATQKAYGDAITKAQQGARGATSTTTAAPLGVSTDTSSISAQQAAPPVTYKGSGVAQVKNDFANLNPFHHGGAATDLNAGAPVTNVRQTPGVPFASAPKSPYENLVHAAAGGSPAVQQSVNTNADNAKRAINTDAWVPSSTPW